MQVEGFGGLRVVEVAATNDASSVDGADVLLFQCKSQATRDGAQAVLRALETAKPGFETYVIANADTVVDTPSAELMATFFPDVELTRELTGNETLLSIEKARREEELRRVEFETKMKYEKLLADKQNVEKNRHFESLMKDRAQEYLLHSLLLYSFYQLF